MNNILDSVTQIGKNISPITVIVLIAVSLVGAVVMIALSSGALAAVKGLLNKLFNKK